MEMGLLFSLYLSLRALARQSHEIASFDLVKFAMTLSIVILNSVQDLNAGFCHRTVLVRVGITIDYQADLP